MAQTKTYRVLREHIGGDGVMYSPNGDHNTREAMPHEVAHLVPQTLVEVNGEEAAAKAAAEAEAAAKAAAEAEAAKAPENKGDKPVKEVKGA